MFLKIKGREQKTAPLACAFYKIVNVSKKLCSFFWKRSHFNPVPLLDYID